MNKFLNPKNPNTLLCILLAAWWVVNLVQAGFTELANDEAYYHMFSKDLAWGYFDHPPMVAFLVWMGNFIGGEIGVRLFVTMLQPLYLYLLWRIIKPAVPETRDATLFFLIAFAMPILQLYGFVATPDAPLMMFTALFLFFYKKFTENNSWGAALLIGVAIAALAYSKYQGALVVAITVFSNLKLLRNPKFYAACLLALVLITPHLWWQYQHEWVSFRYHLVSRGRDFEWSFVTEYLLNMLVIFNPFLFPVFLKGWWKTTGKEPVLRAMNGISVGLILFFLASTAKGYAQPQWVIPATFGVIAILFQYTRERPRLRNYTVKVGYITLILVALVRIEMIFNPLGIKFEIFNNKTSYAQLAEMAGGRPIIFDGSYTGAAKYTFYADGEAFAQPSINNRTSQYQFKDDDTKMAGKPVIMEYYGDSTGKKTIVLTSGKKFSYIENDNFIPVRNIEMEISPGLPETVKMGDTLNFTLDIRNPYPYDYVIDGESTRIEIVWNRRAELPKVIPLDFKGILPSDGGSIKAEVSTIVPNTLNDNKEYLVGVTIANTPAATWYNNNPVKIKVQR